MLAFPRDNGRASSYAAPWGSVTAAAPQQFTRASVATRIARREARKSALLASRTSCVLGSDSWVPFVRRAGAQ